MTLDVLLVAHAAATAVMTGLIWFVQVVHYPLLAHVGASSFVDYEAAHVKRTTWVVAPTMLTELATACALPFLVSASASRILAWAGLVPLAVVWLSTALVQVPCHGQLERGFDAKVARRLVTTNWVRTASWSLRLLGALALLRLSATSE